MNTRDTPFNMLFNYLKITYRHLKNDKSFSFINITGLSIGIVAAFLIIQYVSYEMSYDHYHENSDRIYRVCHSRYQEGVLQYEKAQAFIPTGEAMKNEFAAVTDYTTLFQISGQSEIIIGYQKDAKEIIKFNEENVYHVKGNFFNIFTVPMISGNKPIGHLEPKTVLISSSMAKKYFGEDSPLEKVLQHQYSGEYKIVGVFDDLPLNTHLKFDFLFAWENITSEADGGDANNWRWDGFFTYILLAPNATTNDIENQLPAFTEKYLSNSENRIGESKFWLQPLTDIHLKSNLLGEAGPNGNATIIVILKILSIFILVIAYINYINLSTVKAIKRAKEIGIRKIVGSSRPQLVTQFLLESFTVNIGAIMFSCGIIFLLTNYRMIPGLDLPLTLLNKREFWPAFFALVMVGSLASGLYPALIISSYKPVNVLKGKLTSAGSGFAINLRRGMVTFQFVLAIVMITGSMMVYKQIKFMQQQDLGINIDQTLVVETFAKFAPPGSDSAFLNNLEVLKNELTANKNIKNVTATYDLPGKEHLSLFSNFFRSVKNGEELISLYNSRIDYDFLPTFNARLVAGRNFSKDQSTDNQAVMINMEALKALGFDTPEEAIDQHITFGRGPNLRKTNVIGVVDFRSTSFKNKNYPVVYQINWGPLKYLSIKMENVQGEALPATIDFIKEQWQKIYPEQPFNYFFLDALFNMQYEAEQKFSTALTVFTGLAIVIACLGLYGLSSIVTLQRTKEIGIRKILGASIRNLFVMLSKDFGIMILIAGGISTPVVWYTISGWLENYAYQTEISWWIFVLPLLVMLVIVLVTIGQHAIRAVFTNPVESLKYE